MAKAETVASQGRVVRSAAWWRWLAMGGAVVFLHWHTLTLLVRRWYHEPDNTYGFFVPLVSAYLLWRKRDAVSGVARRPTAAGAAVMGAAFVMQLLGTAADIGYLQALSLIVLLMGMVMVLGGKELLKVAAFPILYLWLMIPLPGAVYAAVASPLQGLASLCSASILEMVGIPVYREGNIFRLAGISLEVAEACSGLRSMVGLLSMGILLGYLVSERLWERVFLAASTIPIAVAANVVRIAGTGVIYEYAGPEYGQGFYHGFGAWIIFVFALAALLLEASILSGLFVEEPKVREARSP